MKNSTKQRFDAFALSCNWTVPHPLDMERFWRFVIEAYKNDEKSLSEEEFSQLVPTRKFDQEELDEWLVRFEQGIALLEVLDKDGNLSL